MIHLSLLIVHSLSFSFSFHKDATLLFIKEVLLKGLLKGFIKEIKKKKKLGNIINSVCGVCNACACNACSVADVRH